MNKFAICMALVASASADTAVDTKIGDYSIQGATSTQGNVTTGDWTVEGQKDGEPVSTEVKYIVAGDKEDMKNAQVIKETIKKFDQYFFYAMETRNLEIGSER